MSLHARRLTFLGLGAALVGTAACAQSADDCYEDARAANRECAREAMKQVPGRTLALGQCARANAERVDRCGDLRKAERERGDEARRPAGRSN